MNDNETFEQLVELIGAEAARWVAKFFAGSPMYIPQNVLTVERHETIRQEFRNGATYHELAIKYGFSDRHIRRIVHRKQQTNTMSIFTAKE